MCVCVGAVAAIRSERGDTAGGSRAATDSRTDCFYSGTTGQPHHYPQPALQHHVSTARQVHTHTHMMYYKMSLCSPSMYVCGFCVHFSKYRSVNISVNLYVVNQPWLYSLAWCSGASSVTTNNMLLRDIHTPLLLVVRHTHTPQVVEDRLVVMAGTE